MYHDLLIMDLLGVPFDPVVFLLDHGLEILAILVTIIIYLLYQRKKREFSYSILSETRLFTIHDEVRDRLQVLLDDNPIDDLYLLIIRYQNSGNVSLVTEDFDSDIIMDLNEKAQIISNEIIETIPDDLEYTIRGGGNQLRLTPKLFNEGDSITVKVLISDFENILRVHGRIVGVSQIKMREWDPALYRRTRIIGVFLVALTTFAYFTLPTSSLLYTYPILILYGLMGFGALLLPQYFAIIMRMVRKSPKKEE